MEEQLDTWLDVHLLLVIEGKNVTLVLHQGESLGPVDGEEENPIIDLRQIRFVDNLEYKLHMTVLNRPI